MQDKVTHAVATTGVAGGLTAPWWMPSLDQATKIAALAYSILGIIWLIRKIVRMPPREP